MKKLILPLLIILFTLESIYSQDFYEVTPFKHGQKTLLNETTSLTKENDLKTFNLLNRPSTKNDLSKILSKNISAEELASIKFNNVFPNLKNIIRVNYQTDQNGELADISLNVGYRKLNDKIKKIVKSYLSEKKLVSKHLKSTTNYLQLFSKQNDSTIIKTSSVIVMDREPCYEKEQTNKSSCTKLDMFLHDFFSKNIKIKDVESELSSLGIYFRIEFNLSKNGQIINPKIISNRSKKFKSYILNIFQRLNFENLRPVTRNGISIDSKITYPIHLTIEKKPGVQKKLKP